NSAPAAPYPPSAFPCVVGRGALLYPEAVIQPGACALPPATSIPFAPETHRTRRRLPAISAVALLILTTSAAAQDKSSLRVQSLFGGGVRASATESWGKLDFKLINPTAT